MLKLYQLERAWGIPNLGPFCCIVSSRLLPGIVGLDINVTLHSHRPRRPHSSYTWSDATDIAMQIHKTRIPATRESAILD